ncbi:MAG: hypothetical protein ACRELT_03030 [Longimicrobiales bacterium]
MDRYFGLIQHQLEEVSTRLSALEDRATKVEDRARRSEDSIASLRTEMRERFISAEDSIASVRIEMRERFISVEDQIRTLTLRMQHGETRVEDSLGAIARDVAALKENQEQLTARVKNVELGIGDLNARIDTLGDDMRQRFRGVHERLAAVA